MIEYQQKYIEDASELIAKLEAELIHFEQNTDSPEIIQELFRVMHTLKGTSGMFGFHRIEDFTHLLEDIYDLIRSQKLTISPEIINLTFEAVDQLKLLLDTKENLDPEQEQYFLSLLSIAQKYTQKQAKTPQNQKNNIQSAKALLYRIVFKPHSNVLLRGIKPEAILRELLALDENVCFQFVDNNIDTTDDPDIFNQYWEIFLSGRVLIDTILDVFLFFDSSEYQIESLTDAAQLEAWLQNSIVKDEIYIDELKEQLQPIIDHPPVVESVSVPTIQKNTDKNDEKTTNHPQEESIKVSARKLDSLLNLVSELILIQSQFENHSQRIEDESLQKTTKELAKLSRNFRDEILSTRLIPIAVLQVGMQRIIRDLSQKLSKEVELEVDGLHTELDKNIITRIENPLMHIIRNCMDHGIEPPGDRMQNKKNRSGKIRFSAFYSGTSVFIRIQDDGRGIDPDKVTAKAIAKGLINNTDTLIDKQIYELLFLPGFSTATEITEVSGRGVGLDVVKNVITDLHGEINIDSILGAGTTFTIKLPLTLSIVDALLINCMQYKILIPSGNILFCKYIPSDYFTGKDLQYQLEKRCVPVKRLSELLAGQSPKLEFEVLILISIADKLFGLLVDKLVASLQAVIKPLGHLHREHPYFIGASQLGDGSTAYILDTNFFLKI